MEAGKKRLSGDTAREANSDEVKGLRAEAHNLKEALAEKMLENMLLKKKEFSELGKTIHEVFRIRETGNHQPGWTIITVSEQNAVVTGYPQINILHLAWSIYDGRSGSARRGANHHRILEETLQHEETAQCIGLPPTGSGSHHPGRPKLVMH